MHLYNIMLLLLTVTNIFNANESSIRGHNCVRLFHSEQSSHRFGEIIIA